MTITVFGASGHVGKHVVNLALGKGYTVKAFGRNIDAFLDLEERDTNFHALQGYIFNDEEVLDAVKGSDAVISTLGGAFDGSDKTRSLGIKHIITAMDKAGAKRIVALGGLGVLNETENAIIMDNKDYPQEFLPVGREHLQAYKFLAASDLDWTFVCSPDIVEAPLTGSYTTLADYAPEGAMGKKISSADIALFMVSELTKKEYVKKRVGISPKTV